MRYRINLICYSPVLIFSSLRGNAGTDTENYRDLYQKSIDNFLGFDVDTLVGMDPLFNAFQKLFIFFGFDFQIFALGQALFCWILFSKGAAKIDRSFPILSVGILPVLTLDACFNGLRYGMSFALASYLIPIAFEKKGYPAHLLRIIPGMFHSSMFLIAFINPLSTLLLLVALATFYFHPNFEYINYYLHHKMEEYAETSRPSWFSGAFPIFQFMVLIALTKFCQLQFKKYQALFWGAIFIMAGALYLSFFTVASLRFMHLSVFLLATAIGLSDVHINKKRAKWIILFLGVINVLNFYRQIIIGFSVGNVFYLPYNFFW